MKVTIEWKLPLVAFGLLLLLCPELQRQSEIIQIKIQKEKSRLMIVHDLIKNRDRYEAWQKELKSRGQG